MSNSYAIADTHFGHANVIKFDNRPFADVTEMNEAMVTNWNNTVKSTDTIYHLR
jgi:calcineurin-like phosphoesterase family protein